MTSPAILEDPGHVTVTIRAAVNAEGPRIGELVRQAGFVIEDIDWSAVEPFWLVAELDGKIEGAVQMLPGKPIARLELLSVATGLRLIERGRIVKDLLLTACYLMRQQGAQFVSGMVPYRLENYHEVLEHHGAVWLTDGAMYLKRIR